MKFIALALFMLWSTAAFPLEGMTFQDRAALGAGMESAFILMNQKFPSPMFFKHLEKSMNSSADKKQFAELAKSWSKNYSEHVSYGNMATGFVVFYYGAPFAKVEIVSLAPYVVSINGTKAEIDPQNIFASFNKAMMAAGFSVPGRKTAGSSFHFGLPEAEAAEPGTNTVYNSLFVGTLYSMNGAFAAKSSTELAETLAADDYILSDKSWLPWLPFHNWFYKREKVKCNGDLMEGEFHPAANTYLYYVASRNDGVTMRSKIDVRDWSSSDRNARKKIEVYVRAKVEKVNPRYNTFCTKKICEMAKNTKGLDVNCNMTSGHTQDCEIVRGERQCSPRVEGATCDKLKEVLLTTAHKFEMCLDHDCTDKMDIPSIIALDRLGEYYDAFKKYEAAENQFLSDVSEQIKNKVIGKVGDDWKIIDPSSLDGDQSTALQKKLDKANANSISFGRPATQKYDIDDHFNAALGMLDCCSDTKCKIGLKENAEINLAPDAKDSSSGK